MEGPDRALSEAHVGEPVRQGPARAPRRGACSSVPPSGRNRDRCRAREGRQEDAPQLQAGPTEREVEFERLLCGIGGAADPSQQMPLWQVKDALVQGEGAVDGLDAL